MSKKIEGHTLSDDFYVGKQRNYTEQKLNDIMDTISRRLGKCDALASCISGYGIVEKSIEVNFIYTSPIVPPTDIRCANSEIYGSRITCTNVKDWS